ncbi:hypothetical protein ABPG75_010703 [Micractinium tetrahymenae]
MAATASSASVSRLAPCSHVSHRQSTPRRPAPTPPPMRHGVAAAAAPALRWQCRRQQRRSDTLRRHAGDFEWSELSVKDFEEVVRGCPTPLMVAFHASWCPSCHQLGIAMQRLAPSVEEHVAFEKINGETNRELVAHLGIGLLPTVILFKGQGSTEVLARREGRLSKQDLELWLRSTLHFGLK